MKTLFKDIVKYTLVQFRIQMIYPLNLNNLHQTQEILEILNELF